MEENKGIQHDSFREFLAKQAVRLGSIAGAWRLALPPIEKIAHRVMMEKGDELKNGSLRGREDKFYLAFNVIRTAFKAYERGSPSVREKTLSIFLKEFMGPSQEDVKAAFREKYGVYPPGFMTISPEGTCNLKCKNCYAASLNTKMKRLSAETFKRILAEKYEKWGSWFTVISGGEPFIWNDNGTDLIDIARQNPKQFFMVYTNGTLIDKTRARRMAECGNISPAVSVEGFEAQTDARRGEGTHKKIMAAFEHMREAGVPFGISVTATADNAEQLFTDEMIEFYMNNQGALYEWVFQYMPIGRGADVKGQVPPDARTKMWAREQELIRKYRILLADFWNGGQYSSGCIAGGRRDGYLYVDWNGNVYPCVFVPYYKDNVDDLYNSGKSLTDALFSDLFAGFREWQSKYSYMRPVKERGNEMRPCPMRDHHADAREIFIRTCAKPGNESARICLEDQGYCSAMFEYDEKLAELMDPIWERDYRT